MQQVIAVLVLLCRLWSPAYGLDVCCLPQVTMRKLAGRQRLQAVSWLAPECFRGEGLSKHSDVYSFGILMWELYTGQVRHAMSLRLAATTGSNHIHTLVLHLRSIAALCHA